MAAAAAAAAPTATIVNSVAPRYRQRAYQSAHAVRQTLASNAEEAEATAGEAASKARCPYQREFR